MEDKFEFCPQNLQIQPHSEGTEIGQPYDFQNAAEPLKTEDLINGAGDSSVQEFDNNLTEHDRKHPYDLLLTPPVLLAVDRIKTQDSSNHIPCIAKEEANILSNNDSFNSCINSTGDFTDLWLKPHSIINNKKRSFSEVMSDALETCLGSQKQTVDPAFAGEGIRCDETQEDIKSEVLKSLNFSVFDTLNNDFFPAVTDPFGSVPDNASEQKLEASNIPDSRTSLYNTDFFSHSAFDIRLHENQVKESSFPEPAFRSFPYAASDHFDLEAFLSSPAKLANSCDNKETYVNFKDLKSGYNFHEGDKDSGENVEDIPNGATERELDKSPIMEGVEPSAINVQTNSADGQKWTFSKRMHYKVPKDPKKNLIAVRRVRYVANTRETESTSDSHASETICFATHPAAKTFTKKYGKKFLYKTTKTCKNPIQRKSGEKWLSNNANGDKKQTLLINSMVLPIGETGCIVSIPASTCVDISSFSSRAFHEMLRNEKSEDLERTQSLKSGHNNFPVVSSFSSTNPFKINKRFNQVYAYDFKAVRSGANYQPKSDLRKAPKEGNNLINLKNVMKIEIYTKPPKKMIITKSNNQPGCKQTNESHETAEYNPPTSLLSKFIDLLRNSIPDLSEDLMKQLCLPIDAVRRSYLTNLELVCLRRQAHLLRAINKIKTTHTPTCPPPCSTCTEIESMESELTELQKWKYNNIIKAKTLRASRAKDDAETVALEDSSAANAKPGSHCVKSMSEGSEVLVLNQISANSWIANKLRSSSDNLCGRKAYKDGLLDSEKEKATENVTLSINEGAIPLCRAPIEPNSRSLFRALDRSRQWKKAHHLKQISRLIHSIESEEKRLDNDQDGCACTNGCRSVLSCRCARRGLDCLNCRCAPCENPMQAFCMFSVSPFVVRMDPCLMQTIYDLALQELQEALEEVQTLPCCRHSLKLFQLVPNVVVCPYCNAFLSYSWCFRAVMAEKSYERNHCVICCKCLPPLHSHCYICENCTLSSATGKCLECEEEKIYDGVSLG